jgi:SPP1 gp7 family putative phage head morphogenesis protein
MIFERPLRLEEAYERAITSLLKQFFKIPAFETWSEIQQRIRDYVSSVRFLQSFATKLAASMVTHVAVANANSWREAARISGKGNVIYQMLRDELYRPKMRERLTFLIQSNASLISTVPQYVATQAVHHVQKEFMAGRRSEDILNDLSPYMQNLKQFEIRRIARTEVAKADTAITRTRAEDIGLSWYRWSTSHDARVRRSHRNMAAVLVNWNEPPAPELLIGEKSQGHYHAGNIYNCRCIALPVVNLSEVRFPAKVYTNGRIRSMNEAEFRKISGIPLAA